MNLININDSSRDVLLVASDLKFIIVNNIYEIEIINLKKELLRLIENNLMLYFFKKCIKENVLEPNKSMMNRMKDKYKKFRVTMKKKLRESLNEDGEIEIRNIKIEIAKQTSLSVSYEQAVKTWESIDGVSSEVRIDIFFSILRIALAYDDHVLFKKIKILCNEEIEKSGDWDRRNRFFIYEALFYIRERSFIKSIPLLLKSTESFTATEIINFSKLINYIILAGVLSIPRIELKEKIIDNPDILQVIKSLPFCKNFINSFYNCNYKEYMKNLTNIMKSIKKRSIAFSSL